MSTIQKSRLGVVDTLYYLPPEKESTSQMTQFTRWLVSDDQPMVRSSIVTEDWSRLQVPPWIERTSQLMLANELPVRTVYPTPEELQDQNRRVVEVGIVGADETTKPLIFSYLLPGESIRINPVHQLSNLRLRCQHEQTSVLLFVVPE